MQGTAHVREGAFGLRTWWCTLILKVGTWIVRHSYARACTVTLFSPIVIGFPAALGSQTNSKFNSNSIQIQNI